MSLYLISYDISSDFRRTAVSNHLLNVGRRVQKSVFECHLSDKVLQDVQRRMSELIDHRCDSVRIYQLCKKCFHCVEVLGQGEPPELDLGPRIV